MKIDVTTSNNMLTVRRIHVLWVTDRKLSRLTRWRKRLPNALRPSLRKHHVGARDYIIKRTWEVTWLGLVVTYTRRYPLTAEQRAGWASQSHLADVTRLRHF